MRVVPFVMDRKGLPEHGEAAEDRFPPCVEIGSEPVDMLQLLQQLRNTTLAWACALVDSAPLRGVGSCGRRRWRRWRSPSILGEGFGCDT